MSINRKGLVALIFMIMIAIQLQPLLHNAASGDVQASVVSSPGIADNNTGGKNVSVFIPTGDTVAQNYLSGILSSHGISEQNFGLISTFILPPGSSGQILNELNYMQKNLGARYYISNGTALAYPQTFGMNITPEQQPANAYLPNDIKTAYNFTYPLAHNNTGKGETIAIVDAYGDPLIRYDVNAFDNITGLPPINLQVLYPNNYHPTKTNYSWSIETATDVEWAHALAPGAKIKLVVAADAKPSSLDTALSYVVSNHIANIISLSWGIAESQLGSSGVGTFSGVFKYAAQEGITVLAATGDQGAFDGTSQLTVNFPSSDPYVLAIGGTSLYPTSNGGYTESAWGGLQNGVSYGSGGGFSAYFSRPWWQVAPGVNSTKRGVPDVALDANKNTGMMVITQGGQYKIGGTSIATPIWADAIALMNGASNRSLGFVTPLLYKIADSPLYNKVFTDITTGNNGYYNASAGWDPVTGLGTPKVSALINVTKDFLSPYGSVALINGTGYNSTAISADLSLNGSPASETFNGTSFYYLGSYYNSQNYIRYGIAVNNTTVSEGYTIAQNGKEIQSFTPIGSYTSSKKTYSLTIEVNGSRVYLTENGHEQTLGLFLGNYGMGRLSFGAEQMNSGTNMTRIPGAEFNNVSLGANGTSTTPSVVNRVQYSGTGITGYSTVQISSVNASSYTVGYNARAGDGTIGTSLTSPPEIGYNITYSDTPVAEFHLMNSASTLPPAWYVDGSQISGNTHTFTSGGVYNITAVSDSKMITRFVSIPFMTSTSLKVGSNISYDATPHYSLVSNHFYSYSSSGSITVPGLQGTNNASIQSFGFQRYSKQYIGGGTNDISLAANNVTVSVFTFPGNATVAFNNRTVKSSYGISSLSFYPGKVYISDSVNGFKTEYRTLQPMPGMNQTLQISLKPQSTTGMSAINGTVSDSSYKFPLGGVNVSVSNSSYVYTNSTGYFIMYLQPGSYNVTFNRTLYNAKSASVNLTAGTIGHFQVFLSPKNVDFNVPDMRITNAIPILFYFGYVSWNRYTGPDFGAYLIYVSNNPSMNNANRLTFTNANTTHTFLTGITPGSTHYITVSVLLKNSQIYGSKVSSIGYNNSLIFGLNAAAVLGIIVYIAMAIRFIGRMKRKRNIKF